MLGDGGHLGCEKSLPTQGDLEGLLLRFRSASNPLQNRSKSHSGMRDRLGERFKKIISNAEYFWYNGTIVQ